ncbi:hypothetical protein [Solirubrum puertoriconensis]|uniref:hypothetical protein n=1 Tax=Solirubrum puertoriconensis TaxID=1751427 RepID=UPI001365B661|nr:hypothetical protein [Solirubrum puertoriconensis]
MTISHRDSATEQAADQSQKVTRMACCCKLSDLLPIVRQQLLAKRDAAQGVRPEAEAA